MSECAAYAGVLRKAFTRHYQENTDVWTHDNELRAVPSLIQGKLKLPYSTKVLDIGCGSGRDTIYFANLFESVIGIDGYDHPDWLAVQQQGKNVNFFCTGLLSYRSPFCYDLILDNGCFHHQHPQLYDSYLKKVVELMRDSGVFVLSTFKNSNCNELIDDNGRLHKYFGNEELHKLLQIAGLKVFEEFDIYRTRMQDYYRLSFCELA